MPAPLALRWTDHAVGQLAALAEYISLDSPLYAEQVVDRIVARLEQARHHPHSGRVVPEFLRDDLRELVEPPYRILYRIGEDAVATGVTGSASSRSVGIATTPANVALKLAGDR